LRVSVGAIAQNQECRTRQPAVHGAQCRTRRQTVTTSRTVAWR
jgi:hypothetical protein